MHQLFFLLVVAYSIDFTDSATCNVLDYGAKTDNHTDVGPAIIAAYKYLI